MAEHTDFAASDFKTPQGAASMERQWLRLKEALDDIGPARSVDQWKVCWRDQKRKARVEGGALNKAMTATGNAVAVPELSAISEMVLGTIGVEMAIGCGPPESPIGVSAPVAPLVPAPVVPLAPAPVVPLAPAPVAPLAPAPVVPLATTPQRRSRVRKAHPPDRFLKAQEENNKILKDILAELKTSNRLRQDEVNLGYLKWRRNNRRK